MLAMFIKHSLSYAASTVGTTLSHNNHIINIILFVSMASLYYNLLEDIY